MKNTSPSIRETMFAQIADKMLFEQAKSYAYAYMDEANRRRVFPENEAIEKLAVFDEPLPQYPQRAIEILGLLDEYGSPATDAQTGGRYFGFVNGNAIPTALAARWLSDIWDQNPALHVISPIVAKLEQVCERWIGDLLGLPSETVDGLCERATLFAEQLAANGFRVLNEVVFNQVLVACNTPAETQATLAGIQASGECWCGGTNWQDKPAIRISVCSWATTADDVARSVQAFIKARDVARMNQR